MQDHGRRCRGQCKSWARKNLLLLVTALAITIGVILGLSLRSLNLSLDEIIWIKIWGELFMRMLKMIILPMVMACLIVGLSNLEGSASGKIGAAAMLWVFTTQIIGIIIGIVFAVLIHPGSLLGGKISETEEETHYTDVFGDFLRNLIPDNMVQACLQSAYTERTSVEIPGLQVNQTINKATTVLKYRNGMNTLGVVIISLIIGFGIQAAGQRARPLAQFFDAVNVVIFKIVGFILWYSPIGIMSLIAGALVEVDNLGSTMKAMAMYILTVVSGLLLYQLIILPVVYLLVLRKNPLRFFLTTLEAMLAGGAAASSAVGFPFLIKASEEDWNINTKVSNFCLPIFTQVNRDGSVLFMAVCVTFIAQTYGVSISIAQYFLIGLLLTLLSVTLVAVPSSSIVVVIMIAGVINVPVTDRLGLIMAIEWLLDRLRTMANLESNAVGVSVIDHFLKKSLHDKQDEESGDDFDEKDDEEEFASVV